MQLKNPHKTTTILLQSLFFLDWRRNVIIYDTEVTNLLQKEFLILECLLKTYSITKGDSHSEQTQLKSPIYIYYQSLLFPIST